METKQLIPGAAVLLSSVLMIACAPQGTDDAQRTDQSSLKYESAALHSGVFPTLNFSFENSALTGRTLARGPQGGNSFEQDEDALRGPGEEGHLGPGGEGHHGPPEGDQRGPLLSANSSTFERWIRRMDFIIEETNETLSSLNSEELDATGSFSGKGYDGRVSGTISALSGDPTYQYEALVCYDNTGFLSVKWSADESQIESTKDFSKMPSHRGNSAANLLSKVIYSNSGRKTTVEMLAHGAPWHRRFDMDDEALMTHYMYGQTITEGATFIRSVQDWYSSVPENFTADAYLTGKIEADESGEYVAYLSSEEECAGIDFDENSVTGESWCLGKAIGSDTDYSAEELSQAWNNLSDIGIAKQSNLQTVALQSNLSCP
ncbi:MAG: hypothetical protein HQM13_21150 [SAR324 cluster bacterium]|nr:hypothetical protein [SAR324 cluster bacterium]